MFYRKVDDGAEREEEGAAERQQMSAGFVCALNS